MLDEIDQNKRYMYFSVLIAIFTILPQLVFSPFLLHTLFLAFTFVWLIAISKFSRILFAIFILFINGMNIIVGHIAMHWGYANADLSPRFETIAVSPKYERLEYLQSYIDYRDIVLFLYSLFVITLLIIYIRHFRHSYVIVKKVAIGIFLVLSIAFSPYHDHVEKPEPFSIPSKYLKASTESVKNHDVLQRKKYLHAHPITVGAIQTQMYDKVVLILGESANKNHMGIYGYKYPTTPFLTSLYQEGKIFRFNAIAASNQTSYSVPMLLTKAHVNNFQDAFIHSRSLIGDYKAAGYKTFWITNQGHRGDTKIVSIADEADTTIFLNAGYYMDVKPDGVIIDTLNNMKENNEKEFYIIHLIGSHGAYSKRYTQEVSLYKTPKNMIEEYDNTIYYTDHVIQEIVHHFEHQKVLIVYVSDHSELISTTENGHGFLPAYKDEYEIPFLVYSHGKNLRLLNLFEENKQHYFNTEHFEKVVPYLSGLSSELNDLTSSRVITVHSDNVVDYEKLDYYSQ